MAIYSLDVLLSQFGTSLSWLLSKTTKHNSCIYYDMSGGGGLVAKSCPTLANPLTAACQGPLSMGISRQILEWVAISFSRGSPQIWDWTCISCLVRWILYHWDTREGWLLLVAIRLVTQNPWISVSLSMKCRLVTLRAAHDCVHHFIEH